MYNDNTLYKKLILAIASSLYFVTWCDLDYAYLKRLTYLEKNMIIEIENEIEKFEQILEKKTDKYYKNLISLINEYNLKTGCELGTSFKSSHNIIKTTNIDILFSIDSYLRYNHHNAPPENDTLYSIVQKLSQQKNLNVDFLYNNVLDVMYYVIKNQIKKNDKRFNLIRLSSTSAASIFKDNELDFLFLTYNHTYNYTLENLKTWYHKIRSGGIIAGIDYVKDSKNASSINQFFSEKCLIHHSNDDISFWWIIKP